MPEAAGNAQHISGRLEDAFRRIEAERMNGVPILNPRLNVEAIGERQWNGLRCLVLVTPWFINLMLFPMTQEQGEAWSKLAMGSSVSYRFPAGRFDFLVGDEDGLGRYQMCSLFSPVLEFESHEAAQIAARAALDAIFDAGLDGSSGDEKEKGVAVPTPSRRGLLVGKIGQDREPA
ncbi:rubredoxin [Hyphomicrobium denitrificans 1NES1]|uniref:Rubredoxin n=1 Tax=Hyphomicrobium denitrificans 1NES1 TaxID=670307 RepID=N0B1I1_9HYPH|nr:[NiFe]-hydrogenase assembly chaperone HybE [Hyphomicrobium denitrificans]AGK57344.1 rubredoxin [Hyphomicrobium denitrificans 1NES1]